MLTVKVQLGAYQTTTLREGGIPQSSHVDEGAAAKLWIGLQEPYVKADWDAGLNTNSKSMGIEGIIRDSKEKALVTICSAIKVLHSPPLAEALALRRVMLV